MSSDFSVTDVFNSVKETINEVTTGASDSGAQALDAVKDKLSVLQLETLSEKLKDGYSLVHNMARRSHENFKVLPVVDSNKLDSFAEKLKDGFKLDHKLLRISHDQTNDGDDKEEMLASLPIVNSKMTKLDSFSEKFKDGFKLVHKLGQRSQEQTDDGEQDNESEHGDEQGLPFENSKVKNLDYFSEKLRDGFKLVHKLGRRSLDDDDDDDDKQDEKEGDEEGLTFENSKVKKVDSFSEKLKDGFKLVHKLGQRNHSQTDDGGQDDESKHGDDEGEDTGRLSGLQDDDSKMSNLDSFTETLKDGFKLIHKLGLRNHSQTDDDGQDDQSENGDEEGKDQHVVNSKMTKMDSFSETLKDGFKLVHKLGRRNQSQTDDGGQDDQSENGDTEVKGASLKKIVDDSAQFSPWLIDSLRSHNQYRQKHGAPPLQLNQSLCDLAEDWANKLAREGRMYHRPNNKAGENIYFVIGDGCSPQVNGSKAVTAWYNEVSNYTYGSEIDTSNTGHFTQVVWKSSTQLGIAIASANGKTFVVANYLPKGNLQGQFPQNVTPPQNKKKKSLFSVKT